MRKYSEIRKEKKINFIKKFLLLFVVIVAVISSGVLAAFIIPKAKPSPASSVSKQEEVSLKSQVSLVMVGDNLLHMPLIKNAEQTDGSYNFDSLYSEMKPYFEEADISVIVQETVLGGESLGYSGYPMFNSPQEVGDSIKDAGFDVVLHATNHALDKGAKGVENTIEFWKKYPEMKILGINESEEKQNEITYHTKNGIKFALLNYTDSTNGIPLPSGKKYLVNTVDEEKIANDLKIAEENAEFTIVFMHWGTEYSLSENKSQTKLAQMMCENGADLIMGSHPHVIEPVKWIEAENGNKALVYYSLGNYVSRQQEANNLLGIMGKVIISRDAKGTVSIKEAIVMPTVTQYNFSSRDFKVYPLKNYTNELAEKHGVSQYDGKVSVERFTATFEKVFKDNSAVTLDY